MGSAAPEEITFHLEGEESLEEETKAEKKRKAQLAQVGIPARLQMCPNILGETP